MRELLENIKGRRILVFGDLMLDTYLEGTVDRISPEAPVPILKVSQKRSVPGGAANVAMNVRGLGAECTVAGVVGEDQGAKELLSALSDRGISHEPVVRSSDRPTTVKTRLIAHHQQVARFDDEENDPLSPSEAEELWKSLEGLVDRSDVVIVSDYAKGTVARDLTLRLITKTKQVGKVVLVDPKGTDFLKYSGASLLTPNEKEAFAASGLDPLNGPAIEDAARSILDLTRVGSLLVTLGEKGMAIFEPSVDPVLIHAHERKVFDVTGAGDTVIAALGAAIAAGADLRAAAELANLAAGIVVERLGTTAITAEDLEREIVG